MKPIRRTYFILATPRTGSTLLCEGLKSTGVAGWPRERFDDRPDIYAKYWEKLGATDQIDYLHKALNAATTCNGVCGLKVHWHQRAVMEEAIGASYQSTAAVTAKTIEDHQLDLFGQSSALWLRRHDKVAQAISLYRASRSRIWHRSVGQRAIDGDPVKYDFDQIDMLVRRCTKYDHNWERYILQLGVPALPIWYESLSQSYEEVMRVVLDYLHLPAAAPQASLQKLADAVSIEWAERYHHDKNAWLANGKNHAPTARLLVSSENTD